MRSQLLNLNNGDFIIVTPPPILKDGQLHLRLVRAYHEALFQAIQGRSVWSPEEADPKLFAQFGTYYRKLGELVDVDPGQLTGRDRHLFFICTEPFECNGTWIPGLSLLEQLMGYSHISPEDAKRIQKSTCHSTGDIALDALVDGILVFKRHALKMAELMSADELAQCVRRAGDRLKESQPQEDAPSEEPKDIWEDDPEFVAVRDRIHETLVKMDVWVPAGF